MKSFREFIGRKSKKKNYIDQLDDVVDDISNDFVKIVKRASKNDREKFASHRSSTKKAIIRKNLNKIISKMNSMERQLIDTIIKKI